MIFLLKSHCSVLLASLVPCLIPRQAVENGEVTSPRFAAARVQRTFDRDRSVLLGFFFLPLQRRLGGVDSQ